MDQSFFKKLWYDNFNKKLRDRKQKIKKFLFEIANHIMDSTGINNLFFLKQFSL